MGQPRTWLAYLADSSYWVYLVHLPLTMGLGVLLYGLPVPALAKMLINVLATTALCLASYRTFACVLLLWAACSKGARTPVIP